MGTRDRCSLLAHPEWSKRLRLRMTMGNTSVHDHRTLGKRRPQFSIRGLLLATLVMAIVFSWHSSMRQSRETIARLSARLSRAELEIQSSRFRAELWRNSSRNSPSQDVLSQGKLNGPCMRGVSIVGGDAAFQRDSFVGWDLENASLSGGGGAFQCACFDDANLVNVKLTGGISSFQLASFVKADLSGAKLTGGGASFQGASFEGAKLIGTQILCSGTAFQGVNIDGVQFQGADLSMLAPGSLQSCYFKTPPSYDDQTRFPPGFDPVGEHWTRASSKE